MKIYSHATHYIKSKSKLNFSKEDYSKFKFGDSKIGLRYGEQLFDSFINKFFELVSSYDKITIYSSPYFYIPTATLSMTQGFIDFFSKKFTNKTLTLEKINRRTTYSVDYGNLSASERLNLISNDLFSIKNKIESDELLIFIDDIRITGSHEFVIMKMLNSYSISNECIFLYHAILDNDKISAKFENDLNYGFVKKLENLNLIVKSKQFKFNTRFIKFALNSSKEEFIKFIKNQDKPFIAKMLKNARGNEYYKIVEYSENFFILEGLINQTNLTNNE